jgi:hypothetical protein
MNWVQFGTISFLVHSCLLTHIFSSPYTVIFHVGSFTAASAACSDVRNALTEAKASFWGAESAPNRLNVTLLWPLHEN